MTQLLTKLSVLAALFSVNQAAYTNSLADCQAFAALFDNTCSSTSSTTSVSSVPTKSFVCSGNPGQCQGTYKSGKCTWSRRLCVTCSTVNGETYIRVQTNGLPNHCYYSASTKPSVLAVDYQVKFQWDATDTTNAPSSQSDLDSLICTTTASKDSSLQSGAAFNKIGSTSLDTITGVALSGALIDDSLSADLVDPVFPSVYGTVTNATSAVEDFDTCFGKVDSNGQYHYNIMSPCIYEPSAYGSIPEKCSANATCSSDMAAYAKGGFDAHKSLKPLGISKDGHIIYGPYKADGQLWTSCDVDVCNGLKIDGVYGYAATTFHPYHVGCFGPGSNVTKMVQGCSANGRNCTPPVVAASSSSVGNSTIDSFSKILSVASLCILLIIASVAF